MRGTISRLHNAWKKGAAELYDVEDEVKGAWLGVHSRGKSVVASALYLWRTAVAAAEKELEQHPAAQAALERSIRQDMMTMGGGIMEDVFRDIDREAQRVDLNDEDDEEVEEEEREADGEEESSDEDSDE